MPIPTPGSDKNLGPCIEALKAEGYTDNDQRVAICLSKWRKSQGTKQPQK